MMLLARIVVRSSDSLKLGADSASTGTFVELGLGTGPDTAGGELSTVGVTERTTSTQ